MQADSPSRTAMGAAFLRALHLAVDEQPWVFEDRLVGAFLPGPQRRYLARLARLPRRWVRAFRQRRSVLGRMRAQIVVRSRYAEDALGQARRDGATRYLILAAGLDTFAWRQADRADPVPVLEVDHPATQAWKRETLARQQRPAPVGLTFRPIDFESQTLIDVLDPDPAPQFVSWLGTSYYLSEAAIAATLSALAERSATGSRLVLDYWQELPPGLDGALLWGTRVATALQSEPMRSFFEPPALEALARRCGWRVRELLDARAQNQRYLTGRSDGLAVPEFAHLALLER
ncbi:MAG: class I SAM-dependent methyltransferase [Pseudomonadales bacterium]